MDWSSLPTDYSKKEEALAFSTTIGLIFGELCILALRHPIVNFSQFIVKYDHLSAFMFYATWYCTACLVNVVVNGAATLFFMGLFKKCDNGLFDPGDDYDETLPDWTANLLKKMKIYRCYIECIKIMIFIGPLLTAICFL
ncbi:hypothetical protein HF670_13615 [Acidithiobacillus thiooxidans]|uniref:hypothetical protein n=1 Tax=Acidithiobacillus thiooxidans TaxID=930 RepID=UPI001C06CF32|nr:hypothetical protein [Acidithiobacillus thiooxidans]MBU2840557.1 hypothetical protein [Acidithiobacillus thiooxidans]